MAKLTDRAIRVLKPREKSYRVFDGGGLYLEVMPSGRRYWRLKYRFAGKERLLALGVFPKVSLSAARSGREAAKPKLRAGEDPARSRKTEKLHRTLSNAESLEAIAREWLGQQKARMAEATYNDERNILLAELSASKDMTFARARTLIGISRSDSTRFNLESPKRAKLKGDLVASQMTSPVVLGDSWRFLSEDAQEAICSLVATASSDEQLSKRLDDLNLGLTDAQIVGLLKCTLPNDFASLNLMALKKLRQSWSAQ